MKTILVAAAASLALAACQRPAEETPAPAADVMAEDAAQGGGASGASTGSATDAAAAGDAAADTAGMAPADGAMAPTPTSEPSPVTQATRDGAKEKAEETNLHP